MVINGLGLTEHRLLVMAGKTLRVLELVEKVAKKVTQFYSKKVATKMPKNGQPGNRP